MTNATRTLTDADVAAIAEALARQLKRRRGSEAPAKRAAVEPARRDEIRSDVLARMSKKRRTG